MTTTLACPTCGNTNLYSDEAASIMFPVRLTRVDGEVQVDYTGDTAITMDEEATYRDDIWCRSCGTAITEDDLVPVKS